jgi:predicted MFS family arabinose efflux permease
MDQSVWSNWLLWAAFALLVGISFGYDHFIGYLEGKGYDRGYRAILVVPIVIVTLALLAPFIGGSTVFLVLLIGFFCSCGRVIAGDIWRSWKRREKDEETALDVARSSRTEAEQAFAEIIDHLRHLIALLEQKVRRDGDH